MSKASTSTDNCHDEGLEITQNPTKKIKLNTEVEDACEASESKSNALEFSSIVAQHYNELKNTEISIRNESKILYLRNFNNWVKSVLIGIYLDKLETKKNILDLCCGKGGDLRKWLKGNINHLICADIACKSVEQCEFRYNDLLKKNPNVFTCEFITADCTREHIREKFIDPQIELDLVSCQFSFHYCFESLPQAECMLRNASECLKVGGYFIGTMPNANEIVKRIRNSETKIFKNDIFSIEMFSKEPYPLFGAQYNFLLDSVVKCPEFLVHFPTLVKLASRYGFALQYRENFGDFYERNICDRSKKILLKKMSALEPYSFLDDQKSDSEYRLAKKFCKENNYEGILGTVSKSEWEAISLYQVFVFKKVEEYGNIQKT